MTVPVQVSNSPMPEGRGKRFIHREIFFAHSGPGPYRCDWCEKTVTFWDVTVHHLDHNHDNNDVANLAPMHRGCHQALHATARRGMKRGPYKNRGKPLSESHRAAVAEGKTGTKHSPETIEKLRTIARSRPAPSAESRQAAADKVRGIKRSPETRARMRVAAAARWARQREEKT